MNYCSQANNYFPGRSPRSMADKKTYRTKGRNATSGILLKGNVRELTGYRTATSIPSKFETVLHTGNKERNGFNTRVYRFGDSENDLPGPGNYNINGAANTTDISTLMKMGGSVSKRGCGTMISKDFSNGFTSGNRAGVPGAGSYNLGGQFDDSKKERRCLFAGRSGQSYLSHEMTPGPGDYEPGPKNEAGESKGKVNAAFLSRAIRLDEKNKVGPAPGSYEAGHIPQFAPTVPSSAFSSGVARDKEANEAFDKQSKQPGPSSYGGTQKHKLKLHGNGTHMFTQKVAKGSFSFADQEIVDARLKEKYDGTPGPGSYFDDDDPKMKNPKKKGPTATSMFKSKSDRIHYMDISRNPGPSFYKTPSTGKAIKKSFHLNTSGCWC